MLKITEEMVAVSRALAWSVRMIPEAEKLKLDKILSLERLEEEGMYRVFSSGDEGANEFSVTRKLYPDYEAHSMQVICDALNFYQKKKEFMLLREIDDNWYFSFPEWGVGDYLVSKVCGYWFVYLLDDLEDYLEIRSNGYEYTVDWDLFTEEFQLRVLEASDWSLGVVERDGNIYLVPAYSSIGVRGGYDKEGDLYEFFQRVLPTPERWERAYAVLAELRINDND